MATPFDRTEAFKLGIIDKKGKVLKKMKELETEQERKAYTLLDRVIWNIKKLMGFIPGGGSMLAGIAGATALLMKENHEQLSNDPKLLQESLEHYQVVDHLPDWFTEDLIETIYEAAMNPKTDEKLLQKISDLWEKSRMDPRRFKQMLKQNRIDDKVLNKANLMSFVHSLTGEGEEVEVSEDAPTNAVGTGAIKGTDQFPPFKKKKEKEEQVKTEAVDDAMNLLFETDEWAEMAFDEVNDFCTNFGLDPSELTEEEYTHLVDCLDTFGRNIISETLWMSDTTLMTEEEANELRTEWSSLDELKMKNSDAAFKKEQEIQKLRLLLMKKEQELAKLMNEEKGYQPFQEKAGADYELYHPTMADALTHALNHAFNKKNFEVDADEWFQKGNMGPKKPSKGKTNSYSIAGYNAKTGKPERKRFHAQIYGMDSGKFELNYYVEDRTQGEGVLTEGTWALPDNPQKVKQLQKLMAKPIPVKDAPKALYGLTGDDVLFDFFFQVEKEDGPKGDVRHAVKYFLKGDGVQKYLASKKIDTEWIDALPEQYISEKIQGSLLSTLGGSTKGLDRGTIEQMVRQQRIPADVTAKGNEVIIKHKKYGDFRYVPAADSFSVDSRKAKPLMKKWKKVTGETWKDAILGNRVMGRGASPMFQLMKEGVEETGTPIFVVSPEVYDQCKWGREKYQRWNKVVGESKDVGKIVEYGKKYPDRPIIVKNSKTEDMQYLRFGQMNTSLKEHYYEYVGTEQTTE